MFTDENGGSADGAVSDAQEVIDTGGEGAEAAISDAEIALELGLDPADFEENKETAAGAEALADDDGSLNDNANDAAAAVESEDAAEVRDGDPEWFQQRIDKILKREREAQERQAQEFQDKLEALQAKVQEQEGKPEAAVQEQAAESADPIKQLKSFEQIDAEVRRWDQVLDFAMENLDGVDSVRGEDGEVRDYSAQDMRKAWVNAKAQLRKLQERRVELAQEQQVTQAKAAVAEQARKEFPFLYDAESMEVKALGALSPNVRQAILQDPNGLLVMGILAEGMKVTEPGKRVLKSLGFAGQAHSAGSGQAHSAGSGQAHSAGSGQATGGRQTAQVSEKVAKQLDRLSQESAPGGPGVSAKASGAAPNGAKRAELALERAYRDDNLDDITASIEALL